MSSTATSLATEVRPDERLAALFEELSELAGQRNAIDARIVEIVAEMDRRTLRCHRRAVGRGVGGLEDRDVADQRPHDRHRRGRLDEFPRCAAGTREGRLSLDQVGVIATRAGQGSDEHYAVLARSASVNQLRTAVKLEPRPDPDPAPEPQGEPQGSITKTTDDEFTWSWSAPYHHRLHHRGIITIAGPGHNLAVTDSARRTLNPGSLARPPTKPPPAVAPYRGPTGERADWWWYEPFQPQPPPTNN